jgi:hypothetical protein
MVLALENRAESFSIGRDLRFDRVREIGRLADAHGFEFSEMLTSSMPVSPKGRSQFLKVPARTRPAHSCIEKGFNGSGGSWWRVPGHDDLLRPIPAFYVRMNMLDEHGINRQVARSNPQVLRIQPPLIVSTVQVDRFLEALRVTRAERALLGGCADAILSKSAGEMGPR